MTGALVGYTLSYSGIYGVDKVEVTLLKDESVFRGEYLYVKLGGKEVYLQVEDAHIKRPTSSYDEKLVRDNLVTYDPERIVGKAICGQVGYDAGDGVRPHLNPIPPLTPVYRPTPEQLDSLISPRSPSISVGTIYPTSVPLKLDLKILFRQGALVVGGVGTGKSTLLLTMMIRMLQSIRPVHILLIDWDGEYNTEPLIEAARRSGGYLRITPSTPLKRPLKKYSPSEWYEHFKRLTGQAPQSREMRALYAVVRRLEEGGKTSIEWSGKGFEEVLSHVEAPDIKKSLQLMGSKIFQEQEAAADGLDIVEAVKSNALVHVDFTDAENWDEILVKTREILEACYIEARMNERFGVAVFIDEVHNFAPQSPHEGAASREAYDLMIPLMKLLATTGPRNGVPLFLATQRLSEVDKFISTQMGQNIFAFRVEDVDLERLRGIMGSDVAYSARLLPRGHAIYKGHALRIQRPVITVVEKAGDVASVGKDLLTRWGAAPAS